MDENNKVVEREIARNKIQIILSSIAIAVLVIMEFYIMINYKSNFIAMAIGILLMILALFFLISALIDISIKQKAIEQQKYEDIYNAQKASYLVIKKSFDEMDERLRTIEENSSLPAEDIINAQKAVAKVTISRSKENTDALMNSNDELINQLLNIQEKLESGNTQLLERQKEALTATNHELQLKIAELNSQLSNIEGRIQSGIPVMAATPVAPIQNIVSSPVMEEAPTETEELPVMEEAATETEELPVMEEAATETEELPVMEETPAEAEELPVMEEAPVEAEELPVMEEAPIEAEELPVMEEAATETEELPVMEDAPAEAEELPVMEEAPVEEPIDDLGLDLDVPVEEAVDDLGLDLDLPVEEEPLEEAVIEETPVDDLGLDLDAVVEEPVEENVEPEAEEVVIDDAPEAEAIPEPEPESEPIAEPEPEPVAEVEPEPEPVAEEPAAAEPTPIPDVGVDLSDPNRVMSAEEIEKLFASI